ncbi:hypothetical protein [Arabiibacter massiliensis]|nr:hypothetical protein [Arabiibacter massiliensis]
MVMNKVRITVLKTTLDGLRPVIMKLVTTDIPVKLNYDPVR